MFEKCSRFLSTKYQEQDKLRPLVPVSLFLNIFPNVFKVFHMCVNYVGSFPAKIQIYM